MSIDIIALWHKQARPSPTERDFNVQLGNHFEEIAEMVETLTVHVDAWPATPGVNTTLHSALQMFADRLKRGEITATINDREGFLDALADQIVTATGTGYCAGMQMPAAVDEVNRSNFSKFDHNGQPVRDENGKIKKGAHYSPPNLKGMF